MELEYKYTSIWIIMIYVRTSHTPYKEFLVAEIFSEKIEHEW